MPNTQSPTQRQAYNRQYAADPANKPKIYARNKLGWFVRCGKIERQPCACGAEKAQAHHADYSKPLEVTWLCSKCHGLAHSNSHCLRGHPRTPENIGFRTDGRKFCRPCKRAKAAARYHSRNS